MSKGVFRSHNKVGETMSFNIVSDPLASFDPIVSKTNGRVSWDLDNGSGYTASNNFSYIYPTAASRTITLRTNLLSTLTSINLFEDNVVGHLDMSGWSNLFEGAGDGLNVSSNANLTGITHTYTPHTNFRYDANNCDLTGTLDLRPLGNMGGTIEIQFNPNLNRILFTGGTGGFTNLLFEDNDLVDLDLSGFENFCVQFRIDDNPNVTGMTFYTGTSSVATSYFLAGALTNYVGTLDLRGLKLYDYFDIRNTTCTKLLHGFYNGAWDKYWINATAIVGNHDLTMFPTLGGSYSSYSIPTLTGITHTASTAVFTNYGVNSCDLRGTHDMSMFPNLGGGFNISQNSNLTSITHTSSPQLLNTYSMTSCDITGTHILPFSGMGGTFYGHTNPNLTNIVHSATTRAFVHYKVHDCDLTGNFDLSMLTGLGGQFEYNNNSNLTSITHGASSEVFTRYWGDNCNLSGTDLDVSMLSALGGSFNVSSNGGLRNVIFPYTTQTFGNTTGGNSALALNSCDFGSYSITGLSFKPLSGITMDTGSVLGADVLLQNNNMTTAEVNEILTDFEVIVGLNSVGWSGTSLNISGTNGAPDSSSGAFDGIAALHTLTGSPNNWIVTTS